MTLPVYAYEAETQRGAYARLAKHCLDLDGTKLILINKPEPKLPYPAICNHAFLEVCREANGKPFIWLEADAIPLKAGWVEELTREWLLAKSYGKQVVWSSDSTIPFDMCGGIGVYGENILDLVPDSISIAGFNDGFDGYLLKNHSEKIHKTRIIHHSYGEYADNGRVTLHQKPKPRAEAVVFHKDQCQTLINPKANHFGSSGELGDIIYMLPLLQQMAEENCLWLYDRPWTRPMRARFETIAPLLRAQPYVSMVSFGGIGILDIAPFRESHSNPNTLLYSQALWANKKYGLDIPLGDKQWLYAKPAKESSGKVVISRSARYHNDLFPWKGIVEHYGSKIMFIGLLEEHKDFCSRFGQVAYHQTGDMLEVAEIIAGSELFIGNQSSPFAIAEGLKHQRILEVSLVYPDCIYPQAHNLPSVQHIGDGDVLLPEIKGCPSAVIPSLGPKFQSINRSLVPPGSWRYPDETPENILRNIVSRVAAKESISYAEAEKKVYDYQCKRLPEHFQETAIDLRLFKKALANAQKI